MSIFHNLRKRSILRNIIVEKNIIFDKIIKIEKNINVFIKVDENVKIDEPVNFYKKLHLPHHLPMVDFSTSGLLDQKEILRNGKNTKEEWNEKDKNHN